MIYFMIVFTWPRDYEISRVDYCCNSSDSVGHWSLDNFL